MPQELMEWVTILRDAGIGITALLILIYYMRNAGKNDQRGDSIVQQLITVVANNNENIAAQQVQREKHTAALNENTAAMNIQTAAVRELKEKTVEHLADLGGRLSLQEGTLDSVNVNVLSIVNNFSSLREDVGRVEKLVEKNPTDLQTVLDAQSKILEAQDKIFKLIDSRLPERAKTDTPAPMRLHPATDVFRKRETDSVPKVEPGTKPDEPPLKPTG